MRYVNLMSPARGTGGMEGKRDIGVNRGVCVRGRGEGARDGFSCVESMDRTR